MRWFKHMTHSFRDEKLARLCDEYGLEGYGFWWKVVEIVAEKITENDETSVTFSAKFWGNSLGISPKKFQKMAEFCANIGLFSIKFSENSITVDMPNILKFRDEYTERKCRKSGQCRDKLRPLARAFSSSYEEEKTEAEIEAETEKEKGEKEKKHTRSLSEKEQPTFPQSGIDDCAEPTGEDPSPGPRVVSQPLKTRTRKEKRPEPAKDRFGEYGNVLLTPEEHESLCEKFTPELTAKAIAFLDLHIGAKGKDEYKSHNLALRKWVFDAVKEREAKKSRAYPSNPQEILTRNMETTAAVLAARQQRRQSHEPDRARV